MTTKARLKRIVRESMEQFSTSSLDQYSPQPTRNYNQVSDGMKSMANAAKRKFAKDYPEVKVKIDGRQGWIIVNDVKAVNVSSASSSPMSIEDMVDQMKQAYLGHPMAEAKLRSSIRRMVKEEKRKLNEEDPYARDRAIANASVASGPLVTLCQAWSKMGNESLQRSVTKFIAADNEGKLEELFKRGDVSFFAIEAADKHLVPALEAVNDPEAKAMLETIAKALKLRSGKRGDREYSGIAKRKGY